ncbi:hypothetical protein PMAYCL1PPCAC_08126, partial [Pristionchus mayeri]
LLVLCLHQWESVEECIRILVHSLQPLQRGSDEDISVSEFRRIRVPSGGRLLECSFEVRKVLGLLRNIIRFVKRNRITGNIPGIDPVPWHDYHHKDSLLIGQCIGDCS